MHLKWIENHTTSSSIHMYIVYCVFVTSRHDKTTRQLEHEARSNREPRVYVRVHILCVHIYMSMQTVSTSSVHLARVVALGCNLVRDTGMSNWAENSLVFTTRSLCTTSYSNSKVSHLPIWIYTTIVARSTRNILECFCSGVMCLFVQTLKNVSPWSLYRGFERSNLF